MNPEDPPLRWEVSQGDGVWAEAEVLEDLTGGFNYGSGTVELQLPAAQRDPAAGRPPLHWLRCRIDDRTRHGGAATTYSHPPEVYAITAAPIGALLPSTHAARVEREIVGTSDGTPGQVFPLRHKPVLKLGSGETLEVQDPESGDWSTWERREDFVGSTEFDRHFVLDPVSGEIELGPAIRETDGGWTQYGAVPPKGAVLRFSRYRYGGGRRGNVTAGALSVLRSTIPGVDTVANPRPRSAASTPRRSSTRASARRWRSARATARSPPRTSSSSPARRRRASRAPSASRRATAARSRCTSSRTCSRPTASSAYAELVPDAGADQEVAEVPRRAAPDRHDGAARAVQFRGLSVVVNLQASPLADTARVEETSRTRSTRTSTRSSAARPAAPGAGWAFGRTLNQGELYGVVHAVEGVEYVKILRIYATTSRPASSRPSRRARTSCSSPTS